MKIAIGSDHRGYEVKKRIVQLLHQLDHEVVEMRHRAYLLQEEIAAATAEATNRNLHVLAVLTALFLPPTLVIGVFGMNTKGLPFTDMEEAFLWAAAIMAALDLVVAAIVLLAAIRSHPGPEIEIALDVRRMALESIHEDAHDLKLTIDALGHEIRAVKENITTAGHNPLDVAAEKLLVPAALSILRGLRSKKEQA